MSFTFVIIKVSEFDSGRQHVDRNTVSTSFSRMWCAKCLSNKLWSKCVQFCCKCFSL